MGDQLARNRADACEARVKKVIIMSIIKALDSAYKAKKTKGWDKMYFFFDIHATIIKPNYKYGDIPTEFYPHALDTLRLISSMDDICMIMYTCSHPHEIQQYVELFKNNGVIFDYINENPEVKTQENGYGCYDKKPYMNVLFEDKSGFDGETDWLPTLEYFKTHKHGID